MIFLLILSTKYEEQPWTNNHLLCSICLLVVVSKICHFIPTWDTDPNLTNIFWLGPWNDMPTSTVYEGQFTVAGVLGRKHVNFMNGFVAMKRHYHHYEWWIFISIDPYDESWIIMMNHQWIIMDHHHESSSWFIMDHHNLSSNIIFRPWVLNEQIHNDTPKMDETWRENGTAFCFFSKWFSREFFFFTPPKKHLTNRVFEKGTWTNVDYPRLPLTFSPVSMMKMATRIRPKIQL